MAAAADAEYALARRVSATTVGLALKNLFAAKNMQTVKKSFSPCEFAGYLQAIEWTGPFKPRFLVVHHMASPNLAMRPNGLTPQHLDNLENYYANEMHWSAGPHLFVDDKMIHVFSPLDKRGVHAVSFNANGIGLEMLGDFDSEDPWSGRGLKVLENTRSAIEALADRLKLVTPECIRFHRDDPRTSKTCPGLKIPKERFNKFIGKNV